jgi:4-amino-4-deoxy-L-arabinose transferase-like glycosyltransferase
MRVRHKPLLLAGLATLVGVALRLPMVTAARPYVNYVDEGHILRSAARMVERATWDPGWYGYPSLPIAAIATAEHLRRLVELESQGPPTLGPYYDLVEPFGFVLGARILVLVAAAATMLATGAFAWRLAGARAGLAALWVAALLPALVARGAIVTVDVFAALFVLLALDAADRARVAAKPGSWVVLSGVAVGLAATSKYPSGIVCLGVALSFFLAEWPWRRRLAAALVAGAAASVAAVLAMPALLLRPDVVWSDVAETAGVYVRTATGSYLEQAVRHAEWDLAMLGPELGFAFTALAAAGLVVCLRHQRWRRVVLPWLAFGVPLMLILSSFAMRPFRNVLPLVPLTCVLIGCLIARLGARARHPWVVDAVAFVLPVALFGPQLTDYVTDKSRLEDSRVEAVDWLAQRAEAGDSALVLAELAILPTELKRVDAEVVVRPWVATERLVKWRRPRFMAVGSLLGNEDTTLDAWRLWSADLGYTLRAQAGEDQTPPFPSWWRGNRQRIYLFERVPP